MEKQILSLLRKHGEGLTLDKAAHELGLKRRDRKKLLEHLKRLEREGLIRPARSRFILSPKTHLIRGKFVTARRGFGFITPEGGGEDIFIPARDSGGALQGDDVEVVLRARAKGGPEGRVTRVLRRGRKSVLGVYSERNFQPFLQPFDSPSLEDIPLRPNPKLSPRPGMIVEADRSTLRLASVLGAPDDPGVDTQVVIRRYGLASQFAAETLSEADALPAGVSEPDLAGRRDYRSWPSVTIDGEKAQDFDDAVSIRRQDDGRYLLGVHIADVSHYVGPGTALDREAAERATSVYFPDLTLPMLPEKLSNDLCSLRPRVPRLTVSAVMEIDRRGAVLRAEFHPSIIRTEERLTYTSVYKIFEGDEAERRRYAPLVPDLLLMRELAALLRTRRIEEGSLDFDLVEPELVYREGNLDAVVPAARNEAHRLIEEFMVAANVAVATHLDREKVPSLYRIHPAPAAADLEKLRVLLAHFGLILPPAERIKSGDLQRILEASRGRPEEKFVGVQVLRAMRLAVYSPKNEGHFGLAKSCYTHFTSPIRRYPDLIVHRILKRVLAGGRPEKLPLEALALHSSTRERNADDAEQALLRWRIFRLLKARLGDDFSGTITDVTKAGLIVEIDDYFVEGLLPFPALDGDYYYRKNAKTLRGRRRGKTFDLGQRVRVTLAACDPVLQRMTFVLSRDEEGGP